MSFPSSPHKGQRATKNGNVFSFDSDLNRWLSIRSAEDDILYSDIDSEINALRVLIYNNAASAGHPVGTVMVFADANMPPGFLYADGSVFNESLYPQLYDFLGSNELPDFTNRTLGFSIYDQEDLTEYADVYFGVAGYDGAGVTYDSELIRSLLLTELGSRDAQIIALQTRVSDLEDDLAQAISDRVYTDNILSARLNGHDSDLDTKGRFYVQSTAPSGGPNSGWVNTNTMRLHIWDQAASVWTEVATT